MLARLLIAFREAFEAVLLVTIATAYLKRIGKAYLVRPLIIGGLIGVLLSIVAGLILYYIYGIAEEKALVEAIGAFVAVPVLTSVIYWMAVKGKRIKQKVELKAEEAAKKGSSISVASLGFVFVFREGIETVLFTLPLIFSDPGGTLAGVSIGTLAGLILAYLIYLGSLRMSLRKFFFVTSVLLVFIASGILGYGIHELIEYGEEVGWDLGIWAIYVYRLPIEKYHPLHDKGIIGSILAALFGYATKMELLRFMFQLTYLVVGLALVIYAYRKR